MNLNDLFNEEKVRLDPKCWTGKKIGNPKTKMKGGVRVNNCVPAESVAEGVMYGAENLHVGDDVVITGDVEFNGATGVIDSFGQDNRFVVVNLYNHGRHSFHSSDVSANDYDNDEHDDDMAEGGIATVGWPDEGNHTGNNPPVSIGGVSMPQLSVGDQVKYFGDKATVVGLSQDRKRARIHMPDKHITQNIDAADLTRLGQGDYANKKPLPGVAEGEQQKGADYRDPKEVDYDDDYDAMVARVKKLAGLGPMKTVYDPTKRQYRNMPTAQQPKK